MDSEHPAPRTLARLEEHIDTALQKAGIPTAAYAVVRNGEIILARGVGKTEWNRGDPVTPDTLFAIGSLTKSMTATAILQLREQGKIDLDAPVQSYLPWFAMADPEHAARVSVRHLLNQTSGLGNGAWRVALDDPSLCTSLERTVRALATVKPIGAPGKTWAVSWRWSVPAAAVNHQWWNALRTIPGPASPQTSPYDTNDAGCKAGREPRPFPPLSEAAGTYHASAASHG